MSRTQFAKPPLGARMYEVKLMEDGRQISPSGQRYSLILDFTPGPMLMGTQARMDTALRRLLEQVRNVRPGDLGKYYLEVAMWDDPSQVVCDVPVSWDELS